MVAVTSADSPVPISRTRCLIAVPGGHPDSRAPQYGPETSDLLGFIPPLLLQFGDSPVERGEVLSTASSGGLGLGHGANLTEE